MKAYSFLIIGLFFNMDIVFSQSMNFEYHEIGRFGDKMGQTSLVDVDNDSDLDWVFGMRGHMYWYEYISPSEWKLHEIGQGANTDVGGCPLDVNHDGWIDFVVGDSWYENTGNPKNETFIWHQKSLLPCHDDIAADIDGDGIKDIVAVSNDKNHPALAWFRIPEDFTGDWKQVMIGPGIHGGIGPKGYDDLDNDGDLDIIRGNAWFENKDGKGGEWEAHEVLIPEGGNRSDRYGLALKTWCIDIDKDGDPDVIEAEADTKNGRVFWFENKSKGKEFNFHLISSGNTGQDFHSLAVADFDGDGDMDVLSGGGPLSQAEQKLFIWENISGDGHEWKEHVILEGKRIHEAVAADVDKDGDIDICTKPWDGDLHFYLENKTIK